MTQHMMRELLRRFLPSRSSAKDPESLTRHDKPPSAPGAEAPSSTNPSSIPTITKAPAAGSSPTLWDRAYEELREKDHELLDKYEDLLSHHELTSPSKSLGQPQLEEITRTGLAHLEENRLKYTMFGTEYIIQDQVADAARVLQSSLLSLSFWHW